MNRKRRVVLCALALMFACTLVLLGPALAVSRETTYFTAVNDTILELRDDTMPFLSGGDLYVPYTVFDPNSTGIQLGVFASYGNNTVVLYGRTSGALVFDLAQDTVTPSSGKKYTRRAIRQNSTIFVPVNMVVTYFNLDWSILVDRDYGWVVRIMSASAQIPDADFLSQGHYIMESRYNAYLLSKGVFESSLPVPDPAASASHPPYVTIPTAPSPQPSPEPSPQPTPSASQPLPSASRAPQPEGGDVYVAVRCAPGGDASSVAAALERSEGRGLFFFSPDELCQRDEEVRALTAAGHKIGLLLDGETPEERQEQWDRGGSLLAHILRAQTDMVLAEEGASLPEGSLAWPAAVDGTAGERTASQQMEETLEAAVHTEDTFLLLDDGIQTAGLAARLLDKMSQAGCTFRLSLEPMLAG